LVDVTPAIRYRGRRSEDPLADIESLLPQEDRRFHAAETAAEDEY
jgi:hypothetical protein